MLVTEVGVGSHSLSPEGEGWALTPYHRRGRGGLLLPITGGGGVGSGA